LLVAVATGCETPPTTVAQNGSAELRVTLPQELAGTEVKGVRVEVRGPGILTPLKTELTQVGGVWQGTLADIPAGTDRVIEGFAYDAASVVLYRGSTGALTIGAGETVSVNLMLQSVKPPPPYENEAPRLDSVVVSANVVRPGGSITLTATAHDPNGDALSYAWTASAGTFSAASSTTTSWTAPTTEGVQTLRLQVTDARGTSVSASLEVSVQRDGATGSAKVTIGFNAWPEVRTMQGTPSVLALGATTTLSATTVDADGDALSHSWSTDCLGTFANTTAPTTSFTLHTTPTSNRCSFKVTVSDGRKGQNSGTLVLQVGAGPRVNVAPRIDTAYLSTSLAGPGEVVTAGLAAHDPEGKSVSFSWSATSGTVQATRWTSTSGEADWVGPACFDNPINLVATVTDAEGASTSQTYTISPRESAKCGPLAVTGVRNLYRIHADGSRITVPGSLAGVTLGAYVPLADGSGYVYRAGTAQADGTFVIPNVDRTPYFLRYNASYYWVTSRTLDLSYAVLGRPDVVEEPAGTPLAFQLDGLAPWQDTDDLQLHSSNVGIGYFTAGCTTPYTLPEPGSTSFTGSIDYGASMRNCGNVAARLDPSRGDLLYATQLVSRSDLGTGIPTPVNIQEVRQSTTVSSLQAADGTLVLKGTMAPLPTTQQPIFFWASQFESLVLAGNPGATLFEDILYVSTLPRYTEYGQYAGFPDLAVVSNPQPGQGDLSLALEYGNPYPRQWDRMITAQSVVYVPFAATLPDGTAARTARFSATTYSQTRLVDGTWQPISPRMGPVQSPKINGQDAMGTVTGVGLTPVVTWTAPALGTPTRYQVRVYELIATATGGTSRVTVANLGTTQTQLRLPPNLLVAGKTYFLQLQAIYQPGYNPNAPYLTGPEYDYTSSYSGKFQP
jgi:hypothetical protein